MKRNPSGVARAGMRNNIERALDAWFEVKGVERRYRPADEAVEVAVVKWRDRDRTRRVSYVPSFLAGDLFWIDCPGRLLRPGYLECVAAFERAKRCSVYVVRGSGSLMNVGETILEVCRVYPRVGDALRELRARADGSFYGSTGVVEGDVW